MNTTESEPIKKTKTPENILKSVSKYQHNNKTKVNQKSRNYYARVKADPIRYNALKERQKINRENAKLAKSIEQ
jgi:hypothetical protein